MIKLLARLFIKDESLSKNEYNNKLITLSGYLGLAINLLLFIFKISVGLIISSISVISDAVNNLSDGLSSLIAIVGSKIAAKPADDDHPYGHGRSEYLATLIVGIAIIIVGFSLLKSGIENTITPKEVSASIPAIIILIGFILLKFYMFIYNTGLYKDTKSEINRSVAIDSRNDMITSLVVVLTVVLNYFGHINIEGPVSILVSLFIIYSGFSIIKDMMFLLLGSEVDREIIDQLEEILKTGRFVKGVHDIELHQYGRNHIIGTAHLEVPSNIDVYSMHEIVDELEKQAKNQLNINLSIHMDPVYCLDQAHYNPGPCKLEKKHEDKNI